PLRSDRNRVLRPVSIKEVAGDARRGHARSKEHSAEGRVVARIRESHGSVESSGFANREQPDARGRGGDSNSEGGPLPKAERARWRRLFTQKKHRDDLHLAGSNLDFPFCTFISGQCGGD